MNLIVIYQKLNKMEYSLNYRICKYCNELFDANNGNRLYCPFKYGKSDYCKNQAKRLEKIKKNGGLDEFQRQDFLRKHEGFIVSIEFLKKNLFNLKTENVKDTFYKNNVYTRVYLEGDFALLELKFKKQYLIINKKDHFNELLKGRIN